MIGHIALATVLLVGASGRGDDATRVRLDGTRLEWRAPTAFAAGSVVRFTCAAGGRRLGSGDVPARGRLVRAGLRAVARAPGSAFGPFPVCERRLTDTTQPGANVNVQTVALVPEGGAPPRPARPLAGSVPAASRLSVRVEDGAALVDASDSVQGSDLWRPARSRVSAFCVLPGGLYAGAVRWPDAARARIPLGRVPGAAAGPAGCRLVTDGDLFNVVFRVPLRPAAAG